MRRRKRRCLLGDETPPVCVCVSVCVGWRGRGLTGGVGDASVHAPAETKQAVQEARGNGDGPHQKGAPGFHRERGEAHRGARYELQTHESEPQPCSGPLRAGAPADRIHVGALEGTGTATRLLPPSSAFASACLCSSDYLHRPVNPLPPTPTPPCPQHTDQHWKSLLPRRGGGGQTCH